MDDDNLNGDKDYCIRSGDRDENLSLNQSSQGEKVSDNTDLPLAVINEVYTLPQKCNTKYQATIDKYRGKVKASDRSTSANTRWQEKIHHMNVLKNKDNHWIESTS